MERDATAYQMFDGVFCLTATRRTGTFEHHQIRFQAGARVATLPAAWPGALESVGFDFVLATFLSLPLHPRILSYDFCSCLTLLLP